MARAAGAPPAPPAGCPAWAEAAAHLSDMEHLRVEACREQACPPLQEARAPWGLALQEEVCFLPDCGVAALVDQALELPGSAPTPRTTRGCRPV